MKHITEIEIKLQKAESTIYKLEEEITHLKNLIVTMAHDINYEDGSIMDTSIQKVTTKSPHFVYHHYYNGHYDWNAYGEFEFKNIPIWIAMGSVKESGTSFTASDNEMNLEFRIASLAYYEQVLFSTIPTSDFYANVEGRTSS